MSVPQSEINSRLKILRQKMRRAKLGGVYLTSREDVHYFSGFTGSDSALLVGSKKQFLITDSRYTEEAARSAAAFETVTWKKNPTLFSGELANSLRIKSLGFSPYDLTVGAFKQLGKGARGVKLEEAGELAADIRSRKSPWEVRKIMTALKCAEDSFRATRSRVKPGMTESDLRLDLEWEMRRRGASNTAFETIVAAGANASLPHAHAGKRKLKSGGLVLIDFGAKIDHYNSDLTRVLFLGSISPFWESRYGLTLQAQSAGINAVCPGESGATADSAARGEFFKGGAEEYFTHSLGHGVGLQVHELPRLSSKATGKLEAGNIVTVEPGLYYPGKGGIRIEDMVLVTESGKRVLSKLEKTLEWAVI